MQINNNNNQISEASEVHEQITPRKRRLVRSDLAKKLVLKGENRKEFDEMVSKILSEILIDTEIENILVEKIISVQWRLRRALEIERNMLNDQNAIKEYGERNAWGPGPERKRIRNINKIRLSSPEIQHILQHQNDLEKTFHKALERLREEQSLKQSKVKSVKL